jgi:hypothetical protein
MTLRTIFVASAYTLAVAACSSGSSGTKTNPNGGETPDTEGTTAGSTGASTGNGASTSGGASTGGATAGSTSGSTPGTTGGTSTGGSIPIPDGGIPTADCSAGCATLVGNVFRQNAKPTHGGKGTLYFALFDGNPITGAASATLITATTVANADLAADNAKVPYELGPFAVTTKELQLMVFLDDDNNVDPAKPAPGKGDLVSLSLSGGIGGVRLKPASAGEMTVDVPLTAALP